MKMLPGGTDKSVPYEYIFYPTKRITAKKSGASIAKGSALFLYQAYTIPWAFMASATFRKPAMLAPAT